MCKPMSWSLAAKVTALAVFTAACMPVETALPPADKNPAPASRVAGWYVQDATAARLGLCNESDVLTIVSGEELRKRAADFGLQDGDPVYVRLEGSRAGKRFRLARIEQFGSPVPIRDCRMSGTMIQQ